MEFGRIDPKNQAKLALSRLKHKPGFISAYITEFRRLSDDLKTNDTGKIPLFQEGLSNGLSDGLSKGLFDGIFKGLFEGVNRWIYKSSFHSNHIYSSHVNLIYRREQRFNMCNERHQIPSMSILPNPI